MGNRQNKLRKPTAEEERILRDHELWVRSEFQPARGIQADFSEKNLSNVDLRGRYLRRAILRKTDLRFTDLRGAVLSDTVLTEAQLFGTQLQDADLQNAQLDEVNGLLANQIAGANASNAKLPSDIGEFTGLAQVEETSKNARKLFLSMVLGCVYTWLTIATTTDARLLANSASSPLPIIQTQIPIAWFYMVAPLILLSLYLYLHLYLQKLWQSLGMLPAVFPDGKALDERAYPWLLNGLVRAHSTLLMNHRPFVSHLQEWTSIGLAWWVVPFTLFFLWGRYLRRHEWFGTSLQVLTLVLAIYAGWMFYRIMKVTLRGGKLESFSLPVRLSPTTARLGAAVFATSTILFMLSFGAIHGVPVERYFSAEGMRSRFVTPQARRDSDRAAGWRGFVPAMLSAVGYSPFAELEETDVSTKPANWDGKDIGLVTGARLRGGNLDYANARSGFMAKADLRDARLNGIDLRFAGLQNANLSHASLENARLSFAGLENANLTEARLQDADLSEARLQNAQLTFADLKNADLRATRLERADLRFAGLQNADLNGARLEQADLSAADLANIREWSSSRIELANLYRVKNAPEGFLEWAKENGAVCLTEGRWESLHDKTKPPAHEELAAASCGSFFADEF